MHDRWGLRWYGSAVVPQGGPGYVFRPKVSLGVHSQAAETYEMAHFFPRETGLSLTIWVRPRGQAPVDAHIKVCMTPDNRMDAAHIAVAAIQAAPGVLKGQLAPRDCAAVTRWIGLNHDAPIGYWDGEHSTVEFVRRMQRLTPSG